MGMTGMGGGERGYSCTNNNYETFVCTHAKPYYGLLQDNPAREEGDAGSGKTGKRDGGTLARITPHTYMYKANEFVQILMLVGKVIYPS